MKTARFPEGSRQPCEEVIFNYDKEAFINSVRLGVTLFFFMLGDKRFGFIYTFKIKY